MMIRGIIDATIRMLADVFTGSSLRRRAPWGHPRGTVDIVVNRKGTDDNHVHTLEGRKIDT